MTRMVLQRKHETPPGGWIYTQFETGARLQAGSFIDLVSTVKKHRMANNIPIGLAFDSEIEDQICQRMPAGVCDRTGQPVWKGQAFDLETVLRGTRTIASWFIGGRKKAEPKEIVRRTAICSSCYLNQPVQGCASCGMGAMHELVNSIVGSGEFEGSGNLHSCLACACALKAKIQMPLELLQRHTSEETNEQLPEWCWLKRVV